MNIEDLTIKQARELAAMFQVCKPVASEANFASAIVGQYCIARCYAAGVHAGEVVSVDGENVILKNSRRLWSWKAKEGIALSGVAQSGIKDDSKVDVVNPLIYLTGVCELIPCTVDAKRTINEK